MPLTSGAPAGAAGNVKLTANAPVNGSRGRFHCGHSESLVTAGSKRGTHIGYAVRVTMVGFSSSAVKRASAVGSTPPYTPLGVLRRTREPVLEPSAVPTQMSGMQATPGVQREWSMAWMTGSEEQPSEL